MKIKASIYFAFHSLNRTFDALRLRYSRSRKQKENEFSFVFFSLNRTFGPMDLRY